jgi:adenylate cyclase
LALLTAVGDKIAGELLRFDEAEILQQERAMFEAVRRYVPAPVAERVAGGDDLAAARREVSVLFVDIRGYTSYSEGREAEEIFSTINRYTETVSAVVRRHGGTVVEFTGDGVMAIFGAPTTLVEKERAATTAARDIVDAVACLAVGPGHATPQLSVGVGIATGDAVVGTIRSADHLIWTAIGNTPNLAARLQSLTRQLEAAIVIDRATWIAAGAVASDFQHRADVPIRGWKTGVDAYFMPLQND